MVFSIQRATERVEVSGEVTEVSIYHGARKQASTTTGVNVTYEIMYTLHGRDHEARIRNDRGPGRREVWRVTYVHLHEGMTMGLWETIQGFFRDAKVTEFYVKISKEEFQGNLHRASALCESARVSSNRLAWMKRPNRGIWRKSTPGTGTCSAKSANCPRRS